MEKSLKERLVGAIVLVILAVIFIPLILTDEPVSDREQQKIEHTVETFSGYDSSIVPLDDASQAGELAVDNESLPVIERDPLDLLIEEKIAEELIENTVSREISEVVKEESVVKERKVEGTSSENAIKSTVAKVSEEIKTDVGSTQAWVVQLGSFNSEANAKVLNERLLKYKFPAFVEPLVDGNKVAYRVRVGPALEKKKIEEMRIEIKNKLKLDGILVKYP